MIAKLLLLVLPTLTKGWLKINGYKTWGGSIITFGGLLCLLWETSRDLALPTLSAGVPMLVTGITHKFIKKSKKEKSNGNSERVQ